jgi:tetratricopeptide (TPR) repeat protein
VLLSPAKLLLRLADTEYALRKLVGEREGRHASLEHVASESYALLGADDQAVWRRLSVFRGSFDLETAALVADVDDAGPCLARLVGASMLERTMDGEDVRFRFLVPLRSFALRCLEESGETTGARDRHRAACLAMAERLRPLVDGPDFVDAMREYRRWFDDVLQVVDLAVRDGLGLEEAVQMAERLSFFFVFLGPMREWQVRMMDLVAAARGRVTEMTLARGLVGMGTVCLYNSNWEPAYNAGLEALPTLEAHGSRSDSGFVCNMIGLSLLFARHVGIHRFDEVEPWLRQCLERVGDKEKPGPGDLWHPGAAASGAYSNLGWLGREQGRGEEAIENLKRGLEIADRHGVVRVRPSLLLGVAHALDSMDRVEEAYAYTSRAVEAAEEIGMNFNLFSAHSTAWIECLLLGDHGSALRHAQTTASLTKSSGHPEDTNSVLAMLGVTEYLIGSHERGLRNWELAIRASIQIKNWTPPPRLQWLVDIVQAIKPGPPIKMDDPLIVSAMAESMEHFRLAALAQAKERQDQGQHPEGDGQA